MNDALSSREVIQSILYNKFNGGMLEKLYNLEWIYFTEDFYTIRNNVLRALRHLLNTNDVNDINTIYQYYYSISKSNFIKELASTHHAEDFSQTNFFSILNNYFMGKTFDIDVPQIMLLESINDLSTLVNKITPDKKVSVYIDTFKKYREAILANDIQEAIDIYYAIMTINRKQSINYKAKEDNNMTSVNPINIRESNLGSILSTIHILSEELNIDKKELYEISENVGYYSGETLVSETADSILLKEFKSSGLSVYNSDRVGFVNKIKKFNDILPDSLSAKVSFSESTLCADIYNNRKEVIGSIRESKQGQYEYSNGIDVVSINLKEASVHMIQPYYTIFNEDLVDTIRQIGSTVADKASGWARKLNKLVSTAIAALKKIFISDDREEIIKGGLPKASRLFKLSLTHILLLGVAPSLAVVSIISTYIYNNRLRKRERDKLLNELKAELELVEEKLKDADSAGDKKAKYALMRVRQAINKDIDRIRYRLRLDEES